MKTFFFKKNAYAVVFVFFTGVWLQVAWSTRSSGHTFPLMQMNMLGPFEGFEYSLHNYFATNRFFCSYNLGNNNPDALCQYFQE